MKEAPKNSEENWMKSCEFPRGEEGSIDGRDSKLVFFLRFMHNAKRAPYIFILIFKVINL